MKSRIFSQAAISAFENNDAEHATEAMAFERETGMLTFFPMPARL